MQHGSVAGKETHVARMSRELKRKLQADPQASVDLIVRTAGDPAEHVERVRAMGLDVRRQFTLLNAIAITGTAADCLRLAKEPWVESVEEDQIVHTMS